MKKVFKFFGMLIAGCFFVPFTILGVILGGIHWFYLFGHNNALSVLKELMNTEGEKTEEDDPTV